jgi:pyrroloquinoline quinone biosynthesis protein B
VELVVLGIAQDGGHPQAGCTQACCAGAWDGPHHHVASAAIVEDGRAWLVDATPDFPAQWHTLQVEGDTLAGIFLTHAHVGHYAGLVNLGREVMGTRHLPVYAMPRMAAFLGHDQPWALLSQLGYVDLQPLTDLVPIHPTAEIAVTPFVVPHRDEISETVGYRIAGPHRTAVWLPDIDKWERWSTPLEALLSTVDLAFVDGTFYADHELQRDMSGIPHPFVTETIARLATAPADLRAKVHFVHLNHTNPALDPESAASAAIRAAGMSVAREGERFEL